MHKTPVVPRYEKTLVQPDQTFVLGLIREHVTKTFEQGWNNVGWVMVVCYLGSDRRYKQRVSQHHCNLGKGSSNLKLTYLIFTHIFK